MFLTFSDSPCPSPHSASHHITSHHIHASCQVFGADSSPDDQPQGAAERWAHVSPIVEAYFGAHGETLVQTLVAGITGDAPEILLEVYGSSLAGMLRYHGAATRAVISTLAPGLTPRFQSPEVATVVGQLLCKDPGFTFPITKLLIEDIWKVATRSVEPAAALTKYQQQDVPGGY